MNIVSFGGGTNSAALLVGLHQHGIPVDLITFADMCFGQAHELRQKYKIIMWDVVTRDYSKKLSEITFGEGISKVGEIVDLGVEYGILKKSGSWYSYNDTKIGQGRDAVKSMLKDNPELCDEIEAQIAEALKDSVATE